MQRYLISYEFTDGEDQEEGAEMLINWYESGGPQNRPENYEVHSWIFMVQNGIGHSVVSADTLETIWKQWHPWRRLWILVFSRVWILMRRSDYSKNKK